MLNSHLDKVNLNGLFITKQFLNFIYFNLLIHQLLAIQKIEM